MRSRQEIVEWLEAVRTQHQLVLNVPVTDTVLRAYLLEGYREHQRRVFRDCLIGFTGKDYQLALEVLDGVAEDEVGEGRPEGVRSGRCRGRMYQDGASTHSVGISSSADDEFAAAAAAADQAAEEAAPEVSKPKHPARVPQKRPQQRSLV